MATRTEPDFIDALLRQDEEELRAKNRLCGKCDSLIIRFFNWMGGFSLELYLSHIIVAVKCADIRRNTGGEGGFLDCN